MGTAAPRGGSLHELHHPHAPDDRVVAPEQRADAHVAPPPDPAVHRVDEALDSEATGHGAGDESRRGAQTYGTSGAGGLGRAGTHRAHEDPQAGAKGSAQDLHGPGEEVQDDGEEAAEHSQDRGAVLLHDVLVDVPEQQERGLEYRHVLLERVAHGAEVDAEGHEAGLQLPQQTLAPLLPALQDHGQQRVHVRNGDAVLALRAEQIDAERLVDHRLELGHDVDPRLCADGRCEDGGLLEFCYGPLLH
mmetsp:Transcript_96667/g.306737  ORF Transcript_96667/g.306737 Transcript_96667/m.306737 type:complete len:247 (+) Transcript_96667:170-910(+)